MELVTEKGGIHKQVIVHPIVLLSIVDHYNRSAKDTQKRVVGCLLGTTRKGVTDVTNSFAVPFDEDKKNPSVWFYDHNYMDEMYTMFRKVNGPKLCPCDPKVHEVLRRFTPEPVLVVADVRPCDTGVPTEAYAAKLEVDEMTEQNGQEDYSFVPVAVEIGSLEAEDIGVEHLLRDSKDATVSTLSQQIHDQVASLNGLGEKLSVGGDIVVYLSDVLAGKLPIRQEILRSIQEIFNLLPNVLAPEISEALNEATADNMTMIYISSIFKSVLAVYELVKNKQSLIQHEKKQAEIASMEKDKKEEEKKKKEAEKKKKEEKANEEKEKKDESTMDVEED